ncbi:MAG: DUF3883 domain-containing protein [Candidatus Polarisedimenticolaceae bacterium]|nr:DUF3883 domain-containing protein [Candidatus Polarisedimenticolaceae bacterium]
MKVLFARVGYMKFYKGPQIGDEKPIGGGSYNDSEIGGEAYNFTEINDCIYGYFQPHMKEPHDLNLQRIKKDFDGDLLNNVLVIWFATNPIEKGQIIIGWYKNATVYRHIQEDENLTGREYKHYNIKVNSKDAFLLPISNRKYPVGHNINKVKAGNPGQSNAFYQLKENGQPKDFSEEVNEWVLHAIDYVKNYKGMYLSGFENEVQENITTSTHSFGGQGFQSDVETRLMIEAYSMKLCQLYYENKGFEVKDVSANYPYDLLIKKKGKTLFIEVKGTQTRAENIILTKNEVALSKNHGEKMVLFIVHSIEMNKKSVKKGSGVVKIIKSWVVNPDMLTPISYTYKMS